MFEFGLEGLDEKWAESKDEPKRTPWIGVDLDGTLATYDTFKGWDKIGDPVPKMVERIKKWLEAGFEVRVLTARASEESCKLSNVQPADVIKVIEDWTEQHIGTRLKACAQKDCDMVFFVDDSCVQIKQNTGEPFGGEAAFDVFKERLAELAPKEDEKK